jgi:hypothetical protein
MLAEEVVYDKGPILPASAFTEEDLLKQQEEEEKQP